MVGAPTIWYMRATYRQEVHAAWREANQARETADVYRRTIEEAPRRFAAILNNLISEAATEVGGPQLMSAARALVAARNGFDSVLDTIKNRLNSEITALERELAQPHPNAHRIAELIETLRRKWPAKQEEIEAAIRKILTDLGLSLVDEGIYGGRSPFRSRR